MREFRFQAQAPDPAIFEYMDGYVTAMYDFIEQEVPEVHGVLSITSPSFGGEEANSGF